ncbi:MAG: hypothetical protein ACI9TK_001561 [Flavobacteriaceae bacterium]|jgi:hypothetical protein|tara:strand:- start:3436 stop:4419 length:984 start_codon:yes stop_codon:yes gene_type:complete
MNKALHAFDKIVSPTQFEQNALELFKYQHKNNDVYRSYCDLINIAPSEVTEVHKIPFLPIQFFKSHEVSCLSKTPKKYFASSKTTGQKASRHYINDLNIYHKSFENGFNTFYGSIEDYVLLALLPSYLERADSSLVYMANHLIKQSKNQLSGFYLDEWDTLINIIQTLEKNGQKTILLGVTFALLTLIKTNTFNLKHTTIMETGGMKGMRKEWVREAIHASFKEGFGVQSIHSEYGMTELMSQAYSKGNGLFYCPPWMRVLSRSTEDPFELIQPGKTGALNIIDLANVDSCAFIATQDLGKTNKDGSFEVLGRFDYAEIRGCNLIVL